MKRATKRVRRPAVKAATARAEPATTESAAEAIGATPRIIKRYGPPTAADQIVPATGKERRRA